MKKHIAAIALLAASVNTAQAKDWWIDVEGRVIYDDNVAVDENDNTSFDGDVGASLELDTGYRLVNEKDTRVEIGYEFRETAYQDRTDFGYQTHRPSLNAWTRLDGWRFAFNYAFDHALLDRNFFLSQHILSPSVGGFASETIYLSAFYRYSDRNYNRGDDARDADNHQAGADAYWYFDREERGYVSIGTSYTDEDARGPEFDYTALSGRASVQWPITLFDHEGRLRLSYTYQTRDYDSITPSIGAIRDEDRHTLRAYGDLELTERLRALVEYRYVNRNSNLPSANYTENVVSAGFRYRF